MNGIFGYGYVNDDNELVLECVRLADGLAVRKTVPQKKPLMEKKLAVDLVAEGDQFVDVWMDSATANHISQFGNLHPLNGNKYRLAVDGRYNFDEVVKYLESYG